MITGRINQVTFHQRRPSAARDWAASATFEARLFHLTLFRSRGRAVSLIPSVFLMFLFSLGFLHLFRQNPVIHTAQAPFANLTVVYFVHLIARYRKTKPLYSLIPITFGVQARWAEARSGCSCTRQPPSLRMPSAMCWTLLNAVIITVYLLVNSVGQ
jgi:hypothetical protein